MDKNQLRRSLLRFLREDIGRGDVTSESIFSGDEQGRASIVARQSCVAAGVRCVAAEVFSLQNPAIQCTRAVTDGDTVQPGDVMLAVEGPVADMLKAERVALNLLQRMCGIATLTRTFVERVRGYSVAITDTRKTTPGLRLFEKYAVRIGGGRNHRFNLTDGVLIKDNHIAACGSITRAVSRVRDVIPHTIRIEVETDTLEQVKECLACGVDIIMLDNMDTEMMRAAVKLIGDGAIIEASGGMSLETVENAAKTGVHIQSVGALTHSAPSCDIGMDWQS